MDTSSAVYLTGVNRVPEQHSPAHATQEWTLEGVGCSGVLGGSGPAQVPATLLQARTLPRNASMTVLNCSGLCSGAK
jgi:hypothetical protein